MKLLSTTQKEISQTFIKCGKLAMVLKIHFVPKRKISCFFNKSC